MRHIGTHGVLWLARCLVARHLREASNRCYEVKGVVVVLGLDVADVDTDLCAIRDGCLTLKLHTPDISITRNQDVPRVEEGHGVTTICRVSCLGLTQRAIRTLRAADVAGAAGLVNQEGRATLDVLPGLHVDRDIHLTTTIPEALLPTKLDRFQCFGIQ